MRINCIVTHQTLAISAPEAAEKSANYLECAFYFLTPDWQGLTKTAFFTGTDGKNYSAVIQDGTCVVPWEAIAEPGFLRMSVAGFGQMSLIITTDIASLRLRDTIFGGDPSQAPSPDQYTQIMQALSGKVDTDQGAQNAGKVLGINDSGKVEPMDNAGESGDSYTLPIMSDTQLGGGKAVSKTTEDVPVAVDPVTGQLFVPTYPDGAGGDTINVDAELKEYMNVAKPAIASAIINKGGSVEPDDSLNDYATRISEIPNDIYPAETLPAQTTLSAAALQNTTGIKLNWVDVNADGYLILRKENAKPESSADGAIVYNDAYAVDGYTDTGVQKGKVYYYRIFPRNSKNQYQSTEDGSVAMVDYKDRTGQTLIQDLPLGTKIKFGQWNGSDFFWEVVDTQDKASGYVTVAADQNLGSRPFDAPETNNPITNRKSQGNNRWLYSAVRQLLNSEGDKGEWWTAQHEYDVAPSYATQIPAFLKDFTEYEKGIIVTKTNRCVLDVNDGGGLETMQDKVWLPSSYAMGLEIFQPLEDNHTYEAYTSNAERAYQSNWWLRTINGTSSASGVRLVGSSGALGSSSASSSVAVRPFCLLPTSAYMRWSDSDNAYVFADDSQRNPAIE